MLLERVSHGIKWVDLRQLNDRNNGKGAENVLSKGHVSSGPSIRSSDVW